MRLILLGPPGSGKGTQSDRLAASYSVPHISTGDLFRAHLSQGTDLGTTAQGYMSQGLLVPDDITLAMVERRLADDDAKSGFVLDGFPRTVAQAERFDIILAGRSERLNGVLHLIVDSDALIERLTGRRICPQCHATFHVRLHPPKVSGHCDSCGAELLQREDDRPATVAERMRVYTELTEPLVEYYRRAGLLLGIDGDQPMDLVTQAIQQALGRHSND